MLPGARNYGLSGISSIHHLTSEVMKVSLVVSITYLPLRRSGVSVPALAKRIPGFDFAFGVVVLAKRGNLPRIAEKVSAAIAKVVRRPQVVKQLHKSGVEPVGALPQQTALAMQSNRRRSTPARSRSKASYQHRLGATRGVHCTSDKKLSLLIK